MSLRIKNWEKFQHYKERKPVWIKLYHDLLDDKNWFMLDGDAKGMLINLWLLASEENGELPDIDTIAFRLRITVKEANRTISRLFAWLDNPASNLLATCKRLASPEKETETEKETEKETDTPIVPKGDESFQAFWQAYPRKVGKGAAERVWKKLKDKSQLLPRILGAISAQKQSDQWLKDGGQFIPHPATWLNQKRWEDEITMQVIDPNAERLAEIRKQEEKRELANRLVVGTRKASGW